MSSSSVCLAIVVLMAATAVTTPAQTACAIEHTGTGIFICYPRPSSNTAESLPELFHISAQANAPDGVIIRHYSVFLDNELLYKNRLATPVQHLSIELNLRAPLKPGLHTLRIMVPQTGTVDLKNIEFHASPAAGFCDPISTVESLSACHPVIPSSLSWALNTADARTDSLSRYWQYLRLYAHNLKSTEADITDAAAVDSHGNLYIALHVFAGVEIRKYSPNRSVTYDTVVQTCSRGAVSVSGLAARDDRIWVAGNTTACLPGTAGSWKPKVTDPSRPHGFVLSLDTAKPTSTSPVYLTYLADADNYISGIRVDAAGNVYVTGAALASSFPHQHSFEVPGMKPSLANGNAGFVSALNPNGTALLWSSLITSAEVADVAVDPAGHVYLVGRTSGGSDAFLAGISENGNKLSYTLPLLKGDPRAVAVTRGGTPIIISGQRISSDSGSENFVMAVDACTRRVIGSDASPVNETEAGLEVSRRLALDAFAEVLSSGHTNACGTAP